MLLLVTLGKGCSVAIRHHFLTYTVTNWGFIVQLGCFLCNVIVTGFGLF